MNKDFNIFNTYTQIFFCISQKRTIFAKSKKIKMPQTKKCTGCKKDLPIGEFYKNKLIHDGHSNYCIDCTKVNSKKYFERKKERIVKAENENLMKMVLLSNTDSSNADNLMKIMMIEKMCKSILDELEHLKRGFVKTEVEIEK